MGLRFPGTIPLAAGPRKEGARPRDVFPDAGDQGFLAVESLLAAQALVELEAHPGAVEVPLEADEVRLDRGVLPAKGGPVTQVYHGGVPGSLHHAPRR